MRVKNLALSCKALSDETRILCLGLMLSVGEICVCDFVETLKISQSKASRHLRYLLNAGLIQDRREGLWVYYKIRSNLNPMQNLILEAIKLLLPSNPFPALLTKISLDQKNNVCEAKLPVGKKEK